MKRAVVLLNLLVCPGVAAAADGGEGGASFIASFLQMLASLAVVIGAIYLCYYLFNRWAKGNLSLGIKPRHQHIRLVESRFLAPKKSLLLVEVGGEYLLLGSSGEGLSLIKQIEGIAEELPAGEAAARPAADLFQEKLNAFMAKVPGKVSGCITLLKRGNQREV
jgi:flagellar protein FliO/FliZ